MKDAPAIIGTLVIMLALLLLAGLAAWIIAGHPGVILFEDGSYIFNLAGLKISGCLAGAPCNY